MLVSETDTAVVILSYNGKKWHQQFLPLIVAEAKSGYQVYVVNNASTDDTRAFVAAHFPEVTIIDIAVNQGFAHGYHEALRQIEAKYFILLSADFEVTANWFPPLINAMRRDPAIAACQPKIRYWRDKKLFEYAGAGGGFMDKLGYLFCRGRIFFTLEEDSGQYDDDIEVFWASGGCFMVRADIYHQLGGLDADLYAHMEEVDLCWRIKNAGYKVGYIGQSMVYHVGGSVISYGSTQKLFYNFRNNLILLLKNEKLGKLIWLFPLRLMLDGLAALRLLFTGKWKEVYTILRAHFSFYSTIPNTWRKRKAAAQHITVRNEKGIYPKSIVWDYFGAGRRKFSQLKWPTNSLY